MSIKAWSDTHLGNALFEIINVIPPNSTLVISGCQVSFQSSYRLDFRDNQLWRCTQAGSECHCYSQGEYFVISTTQCFITPVQNWIICTYIEEDIGQNVSLGCFWHANIINWKLWLPMWWCFYVFKFCFLQRRCLLPVGLNFTHSERVYFVYFESTSAVIDFQRPVIFYSLNIL